jgi:CRISPR/Cas system CMR-associated protein Cmr3 (group 5 of RAMP superfamily)
MFLKIKKFIKEPTRFLKDIRLFHNFFYKELNENEIFEYLDSNIDKPKLILCYFAELVLLVVCVSTPTQLI